MHQESGKNQSFFNRISSWLEVRLADDLFALPVGIFLLIAPLHIIEMNEKILGFIR
jgi:hypothetical protein